MFCLGAAEVTFFKQALSLLFVDRQVVFTAALHLVLSKAVHRGCKSRGLGFWNHCYLNCSTGLSHQLHVKRRVSEKPGLVHSCPISHVDGHLQVHKFGLNVT